MSVELPGGAESPTLYVVITIYVGTVLEVCVVVGTLEMSSCTLIGTEDGEDPTVDSENGPWVVNKGQKRARPCR